MAFEKQPSSFNKKVVKTALLATIVAFLNSCAQKVEGVLTGAPTATVQKNLPKVADFSENTRVSAGVEGMPTPAPSATATPEVILDKETVDSAFEKYLNGSRAINILSLSEADQKKLFEKVQENKKWSFMKLDFRALEGQPGKIASSYKALLKTLSEVTKKRDVDFLIYTNDVQNTDVVISANDAEVVDLSRKITGEPLIRVENKRGLESMVALDTKYNDEEVGKVLTANTKIVMGSVEKQPNKSIPKENVMLNLKFPQNMTAEDLRATDKQAVDIWLGSEKATVTFTFSSGVENADKTLKTFSIIAQPNKDVSNENLKKITEIFNKTIELKPETQEVVIAEFEKDINADYKAEFNRKNSDGDNLGSKTIKQFKAAVRG